MIGISYACTLLRNDLTNRKIVIKKYAFLISVLNGIVLILYLLDVVTSLTLFFCLSQELIYKARIIG